MQYELVAKIGTKKKKTMEINAKRNCFWTRGRREIVVTIVSRMVFLVLCEYKLENAVCLIHFVVWQRNILRFSLLARTSFIRNARIFYAKRFKNHIYGSQCPSVCLCGNSLNSSLVINKDCMIDEFRSRTVWMDGL